MKIEKKVWPEYFQKIIEGKKSYDLRLADWECTEGDVLILREWDPDKKEYTGRTAERKVKSVDKFKIQDLFWPEDEIKKYGIQIISLEEK